MKDYTSHNKDVYNRIAPLFSDTRSELWDDLLPFASYAGDGFSILDVGCGNGRVYQLFEKKQGITYTGIDQSERLIEIARERVSNGECIVGPMTALPFEDNSFDLALCIAALHHLPTEQDRLAALAEMRRVLRPGRYLLMSNWNLHSDSAQNHVEKGDWRLESEQDFLIPWLDSKGTVVGERYYYGFYPEELAALCKKSGFFVEDQYFSRKGERSDAIQGHNIMTIARKPH